MNGNLIQIVDSWQKLTDNWPFLLEGLEAVRANSIDNMPDVSNDQYFKTLLKLSSEPEHGTILMLKSKNQKPLGFMVLIDVTGVFQDKTANIYIAYSNAKCPSTIAELRFEAQSWARTRGFKKFQAVSYRVKPMPRLSGAVRRYFNKTLNLRERCVVFESQIV